MYTVKWSISNFSSGQDYMFYSIYIDVLVDLATNFIGRK